MSMSELDETKRLTLKVMAGTSASLAAGCLGVVSVANAATKTLQSEKTPAPTSHAYPSVLFDLEMHIISSTGVVENSLILRNTTHDAMHIARFRSDRIVFGGKYVSLDAVSYTHLTLPTICSV